MKKLFSLLAVMACISTSAQTIKERKVDKFSGSITTSTTKEALAVQMGYQWVSVTGYHIYDPKAKEELFMLVFALRGQGTGSLRPGESKITLLTDKGESLGLQYSGQYNLFTSSDIVVNFYTNVTKEQLDEMAASKITDVRVSTSKLSDYSVKGDKQSVLAHVAELLVKESKGGEVSDTSTSKTVGAPSVADELKKLKDLLDSGAITKDEYDTMKKRLIEK